MIRTLLPLLPLFATAACVGPGTPPTADAAAPAFDPIAFFSGRTVGEGRLRVVMSGGRTVRVEGDGRVGADGSLTLAQRIAEGDKPIRSRSWSLRRTGADTWTGTLTDASGPVAADVKGNVLRIRFKTAGGVSIEQRLALRPGGRVADNRLVASKLGLRVAVLEEVIRKVD